jgi:lycopene beta-cyclase
LSKKYDYIIVGAGCSGLSLAVRMIESGQLANKQILLCDKQLNDLKDRTWCYWEQKPGYFEKIVYHSWKKLWVRHSGKQIDLDIAKYSYKMIRGYDFYAHCMRIIYAAKNVTVMLGEVSAIDAESGIVMSGNEQYEADFIFSSALLVQPVLGPKQFYILQHFRGWYIETETDFFDPTTADLMNFNTSQQHGCAFVYVLPTSKRRALVEYTLFTENMLTNEQYNDGLTEFIKTQLQLNKYTIKEIENGIIPMTNIDFTKQQGKLTFIGTAGGQTKASTGYTYQYIQKQTASIVASLIKNGTPKPHIDAKRFAYYDSVLLRILQEQKVSGAEVFYQLFLKNKATKIFKFLDNETTQLEELAIMNSTNKKIFIPAAVKQF